MLCNCFTLSSVDYGNFPSVMSPGLTVVVHVLLHLVEHVDALFVHDLIVGVIAQVVIVNTVVVVAVGDFGEHILRHDDGIFELLQHERIVASVDARLVARF